PPCAPHFDTLSLHDALPIWVLRSYRHLVYLANMDWLKDAPTSTPEELEFVMQRLDFLNSTVIPQAPSASPRHWDFGNRQMVDGQDRKSTRLNSSHVKISYAV